MRPPATLPHVEGVRLAGPDPHGREHRVLGAVRRDPVDAAAGHAGLARHGDHDHEHGTDDAKHGASPRDATGPVSRPRLSRQTYRFHRPFQEISMNRTDSRAALIAAMFAILLAACGGEDSESAQPATANEAASPSPAVTALKVYLDSAARNPLDAAMAVRLQSALVAAGYNLVTSESAPHDVAAHLVVTATQEQSLFQVTVNGQRQVKLQVHAALTISGGGSVVDQVAHDFDSSNGEVRDEDVAPLVARLNRSPRLSRYASARAKVRQAHAQAEQAAAAEASHEEAAAKKAEQDQREAEEQSAWQAANADACAQAMTLTACNDLETWLKTHPNSPHAQEATQTLDAARPKIVAIADDTLWSSANSAACKAPSRSSDCDGVSVYIGRFPSGAHADEARAIRDGSTKKVEALQKKEDAQARLDEQRQAQQEKADQQKEAARQKQEQLEDCKRNCKENMCAAYVLSDRFGLCMSRCVQNTCE